MHYTNEYLSPIGAITLASNGEELIGLWFHGQKHFADMLDAEHEEKALPVFEETRKWLDIYFSGKNPSFLPPIKMCSSPFRMQVWEILKNIPYGKTVTYGEISKILEEKNGKRMSA